uniref:Uncharacterized protein n=1 Tax=Oryza brachyantha TaxID=4533 RepID=J3LNN5_ORYBR
MAAHHQHAGAVLDDGVAQDAPRLAVLHLQLHLNLQILSSSEVNSLALHTYPWRRAVLRTPYCAVSPRALSRISFSIARCSASSMLITGATAPGKMERRVG